MPCCAKDTARLDAVVVFPSDGEALVTTSVRMALTCCENMRFVRSVRNDSAAGDLMFVTTGTRRMWPLQRVGPLTDEYSLTSDQENQWLSGGTEADVIAEAHLDAPSIFRAIASAIFVNTSPALTSSVSTTDASTILPSSFTFSSTITV